MLSLRLLPILGVFALTGCVKPKPAYHGEQFGATSPFEHRMPAEPAEACAMASRALLSQGYQVEEPKPQSIKGRKLFEPQSGYLMELNITVVCLPIPAGAVIYSNALQTRYELKSTGSSAGVSVAGLGSITLPWMSDKESLVKVGEETVVDAEFYQRLYQLVDSMIE